MHSFFILNKNNFKKDYFIPPENLLKQLKNVLKINKNENIEIIFDGFIYLCNFVENVLKIISKKEIEIKRKQKINLIQGIPKSNKLDLIIQKSVEIGVDEISFLLMERSISRFDEKEFENKKNRFEKIALEACEQSKNFLIPKTSFIKSLDFLNLKQEELNIVVYELEKNNNFKKIESEIKSFKKINILIGPEGGISKKEIDELKKQNFITVGLGKSILRTETASIYCLSILDYILS